VYPLSAVRFSRVLCYASLFGLIAYFHEQAIILNLRMRKGYAYKLDKFPFFTPTLKAVVKHYCLEIEIT